ncbi:MAG: type II toxin-antitoxin system VapC family toxin [Acetobacteraceae bacterium]
MIVVDSSALIAILRREPEADAFLRIIAEADGCLLSTVSLLETSLVLAGRQGDARSWIELDALVAQAGMEVVPQDTAFTKVARSAFLRYGKGRHHAGLNLGDCAVYALASSRNLPLLAKGDDFPHTDLRMAA